MPTKGTSIIATRIKDEIITEVRQRATRRGLTINAWLNWAVKNGLRSHERRTNGHDNQFK